MQNIDFYSGKESKIINNTAMLREADNVARLDALYRKEANRHKKRVSRILSFIVALCIISFTSGLILGIKFAGGERISLVDNKTAHMIEGMKNKVTEMITPNEQQNRIMPKEIFPKEEFPYVIRLGRSFNFKESKEISQYLSKNGHTVIVSQKDNNYRLYVGPYRKQRDADGALKLLHGYNKRSWFDKAEIIKR